MPRDIRLTVAAATAGPRLTVEVSSIVSALEAIVPTLQVEAGVTTSVVATITGEAV